MSIDPVNDPSEHIGTQGEAYDTVPCVLVGSLVLIVACGDGETLGMRQDPRRCVTICGIG